MQVAKLSALPTLVRDSLQLRVPNDTVAAYQKSLQLTQNQYTVGVAAQSDVTQV
jgi:outer membrane protein TolC